MRAMLAIMMAAVIAVLCACSGSAGSNINTTESDNMTDEMLLAQLAEIFECEEKFAQTILNDLNGITESRVCRIEFIEHRVRVRLQVTDEGGKEYLAVVNWDCCVEEVYLGDENGKKIYQVIF